MILSEMSVWDESVTPVVRRNQPDYDLIIVDLCGPSTAPHRACLLASGTTQARALAEKLRQAAADLDSMADAIDREKQPELPTVVVAGTTLAEAVSEGLHLRGLDAEAYLHSTLAPLARALLADGAS